VKKNQLDLRKQQYDSHKKYQDFLINVCKNKDLGREDSSENDIEWLRSRFLNLKNENKKLKKRKQEINDETESVREKEKKELASLQTMLYEKQNEMQTLQADLEIISEENSRLEHDFENEINKKNVNKKEIGQIINAVNNITIINRKLNGEKNRNR